MQTTRQWKRAAQVVLGKSGTGLLIERLRMSFEVTKSADKTPNEATIKIYNLTQAHEAQIKDEFADVMLSAGYEGALRMLFRGNITGVYKYREGKDRILEIQAGDGDADYRAAVMNETLAAGTTNAQVIDRAVGSFQGVGKTQKGYTQVQERTRLRGKVLSGATRNVLSDLARASGARWSIQDGQLVLVAASGVLPDEAIVINAQTGMVGAPELSDKGVSIKCLLNPLLKIHGAVKLHNNSIKQQSRPKAAAAAKEQQQPKKEPMRMDPDGLYKVIELKHKGDNRGSDWVSELTAIGINQPAPKASAKQARGEKQGKAVPKAGTTAGTNQEKPNQAQGKLQSILSRIF